MEPVDPDAMLSAADGAAASVRRAGRWYALWLGVFALYTVVELASVPWWAKGINGVFAALALLAFIYAMRTWAARQRVRVVTSNWWVWPWVVINLATVLAAPRLFAGEVGWYALAGLVNAAPVLVEAALVLRRSR